MERSAPLTVAIPVDADASPSEVERSLRSLAAQDCRAAEVILIGAAPRLARLQASPGVRFVDVASDDPGALRQRALDGAGEEWFTLLEPGMALAPQALAAVAARLPGDDGTAAVYTDEARLTSRFGGGSDVLKPGWSPRLILEGNYLGHLCLFRRSAALAAGGFHADDDATGGYDLVLRLTDSGAGIRHVPVVAVETPPKFAWPPTTGDARARAAALRCVRRSLARRGDPGLPLAGAPWQRIRRRGRLPAVTVVVPTRDRADLVSACLQSLAAATSYPNVEVLVVDNDSTDLGALALLDALPHPVLRCPGPFNFSTLMNAAVAHTSTPLVLFLNNDAEVMGDEWLEAMVEEALDPAVGAVGCRVVDQEGRSLHEGVGLGLSGAAARNLDLGGYCGLDGAVRDVAAVTAACMLVPRTAFDAVHGFDPALAVGYGDVDFCLRLRRAGFNVVYTPHAVVQHLGQASRGDRPHPEDDATFEAKWPLARARATDPFVHPRIDAFVPLRASAPLR